MTSIKERRDTVIEMAADHGDVISRARRIYLDNMSFALDGKHQTEFSIKSEVANFFGIAFRSVVFTGSAQLGFSPHKDTVFKPGVSDLDLACIDHNLYHRFWCAVIQSTRSFTDNSVFRNSSHSERMQDLMLRRGMILLDYMPYCDERTKVRTFMDDLSRRHVVHFGRISIAVYMSEYAFCWKQNAALPTL